MKIFKTLRKQQPISQPTPEPQIICPADQKPECSLIQELRDIQKELSQVNTLYYQRRQVLDELTGGTYYNETLRNKGSMYRDINTPILRRIVECPMDCLYVTEISKAIDLLIKLKELTEKDITRKERIKELNTRAAEIKEQLGIK